MEQELFLEWRRQRAHNWIRRLGIISDPELEYHECGDLVSACISTGYLEVCDEWMPLPDSRDSYNDFVTRNPWVLLSYDELRARELRRQIGSGVRGAADLQLLWEAEQRRRLEEKQLMAERRWQLEEIRRHRRV